MIVKKGTRVRVTHQRKGTFEAIAIRDFDTEQEEFYPFATLEYVQGMSMNWEAGESIECRNSLCHFEILERKGSERK